MIAEQVQQRADQPALVFGDTELSYYMLWQQVSVLRGRSGAIHGVAWSTHARRYPDRLVL